MSAKKVFILIGLAFITLHGIAQDVNLDSLLDAEMDKKNKNETQLTEATFKTSRLNNSQTVETPQKGVFDLKISHRFSTLGGSNGGFYNLFGIDNAASMRFGGDYGITDRLTIGGGRSSYEKEYDAFLKYRLLWQSTGKKNMPVSLSLLASATVKTLDATGGEKIKTSSGDYYYTFQALLARKFSSNFSMQLMPTVIRDNSVSENLYSIGVGARLKLTKRSGIIAEYYYQLPGYKLPGTYNSFSLGYEIETGGHVFQMILSNSFGITDRTFITQTQDKWSLNQLHFGFNISRVFNFNRSKNTEQKTNAGPAWVDSSNNNTAQNNKGLVQATFKTSRLINGHTVETTQGGVLDLKVTHRFGKLNDGFYNLFGLDYASMRLGLDYGITDRLTIGAGRSTGGKVNSEKEYDGFIKYRLLWQSNGERPMPVSLSVLSSVILSTAKNAVSDSVKRNASDRYYFAYEVILARKFSEAFSLQLMPTMIHYNIVPTEDIPNDLLSVGASARIKLSKRSSLNLEYYYQLPGHKLAGTTNSFGIGYEIETGGHVFQLQFTNSTGMTERSFITETDGRWKDGDIHFGFNIARVFTIKKPRNNIQ